MLHLKYKIKSSKSEKNGSVRNYKTHLEHSLSKEKNHVEILELKYYN